MLFRITDRKILRLYETGFGAYPDEVIKSFIKKVATIAEVKDENMLRAIKSNHFEKLKGFKNKYSIRLNKRY